MQDNTTNNNSDNIQLPTYRALFGFIGQKNWEISINKLKEATLLMFFLILITGLVLYKVVFIASMPLTVSFWTIYGLIATIFLISRIPYAYLHKDDHSKVYINSDYPNVSVVIAAKNEKNGIFKTIATCVNSDYPGKVECIVIDDGSTDGTKDEVIKAQKFYGAGG